MLFNFFMGLDLVLERWQSFLLQIFWTLCRQRLMPTLKENIPSGIRYENPGYPTMKNTVFYERSLGEL